MKDFLKKKNIKNINKPIFFKKPFVKSFKYKKNYKFRPYQRLNLEGGKVAYLRFDHLNFFLKFQERSRKIASQHLILEENFLDNAIFKKKKKYTHLVPLNNLTNSFNDTSLFFLKKKRWNKYQKLSSVKWSTIFIKNESWKNKTFQPWTSQLIKTKNFRWDRHLFWRTLNLMLSKDGLRIHRLVLAKRLSITSQFWFLSKKAKLGEDYSKIRLLAHHAASGNNKFFFERKIKRDYINRYLPARNKRANFTINPKFKLWRRAFGPFVPKFLGNKSLGDLNYLKSKQNKHVFLKNTAGYYGKMFSNFEYTISNLIFKLKMGLTTYDCVNLVQSGRILVDNKIFLNPNKKIPLFSTIKFKGNWFETYLMFCIQQEDRVFERYPSQSIKKGNFSYLRRLRIPSYFEISFKLQEAILLRQSNLFEQPNPYVIFRSSLPEYLKFSYKKIGVSVF